MINLLSYKTTFCRNGRLSADGRGLIQIECSQQKRKIYFSTKIKVFPEQFSKGQIVNHPIAKELNYKIRQITIDLQLIEIDYLKRGITPTLAYLKEAWLENSRPTAKFSDFGFEMINSSQSRREMTKRSYKTLFNSIDKFRPGTLLQDVDYTFVTKYDEWLRSHGNSHNTRVNRLRLLRTIMIEAKKRNLLEHQPFERFKIPAMTSKRGFMSENQVKAIERLNLVGAVAHVRDIFLFSIYTGLRFSDVQTLKDEHLQKGWIIKRMVKTDMDVKIPITELFDSKAMKLIEKYGSIEKLIYKMGSNATVNKRLKEILKLAGCGDKGFTFHTARHTFASLLLQKGIGMATIQKLMGHSNITTTEIYAEITQDVIKNDLRRASKKKHSE